VINKVVTIACDHFGVRSALGLLVTVPEDGMVDPISEPIPADVSEAFDQAVE